MIILGVLGLIALIAFMMFCGGVVLGVCYLFLVGIGKLFKKMGVRM